MCSHVSQVFEGDVVGSETVGSIDVRCGGGPAVLALVGTAVRAPVVADVPEPPPPQPGALKRPIGGPAQGRKVLRL